MVRQSAPGSVGLILNSIFITSFSLLLGFSISMPAYAQRDSCEEHWLERATSGSEGYKNRNGICEGLYESPVSADFELVSLIEHPLNDYVKGDTILIESPDVSKQFKNLPISVSALALKPRLYYRMDTRFGTDKRINWSVDVLTSNKLKLSAADLGIFGWKETENGVVYIPINAVVDGKSETKESIVTAELAVRAGAGIEKLAWRLIIDGKPYEYVKISTSYPPGDPIRIVITWPQPRPDFVTIEIVAKPISSDNWLTQIFEIALPANPKITDG